MEFHKIYSTDLNIKPVFAFKQSISKGELEEGLSIQ